MREPVQPFFVFTSEKYYKRKYTSGDIAHLYEYTCAVDGVQNLAIPDGCIDVMFDLSDPSLSAYAAGTVLKWHPLTAVKGHTYFGVRFQPGIVPAFLDMSFSELVDQELDLLVCSANRFLAEQLAEYPDFKGRADFFENFYKSCMDDREKGLTGAASISTGTRILLRAVRNRIIETGGLVKIQDLADETGYSSRYIYKLFHQAYGLSPKTYAGIVRFQGAIDAMDHDSQTSLSSLAVDHGYFDQPQFIRDFRKYANTTPKAYRKQIISSDYLDRFIMA